MQHLIEQFHDSLQRCQQNAEFFQHFYRRFWQADPQIPQLFAGVHMRQQELMLQASLHMVMLASQNNVAATVYLQHIAEKHQQFAIPAYLYDVWLECLMQTVAETDPKYSDEVATAWQAVMSNGVNYMKRHAASGAAAYMPQTI